MFYIDFMQINQSRNRCIHYKCIIPNRHQINTHLIIIILNSFKFLYGICEAFNKIEFPTKNLGFICSLKTVDPSLSGDHTIINVKKLGEK